MVGMFLNFYFGEIMCERNEGPWKIFFETHNNLIYDSFNTSIFEEEREQNLVKHISSIAKASLLAINSLGATSQKP